MSAASAAGRGGDFLAAMAASARERVRAARAARSEAALLAACAEAPRPPPLVLHGFDLIAEVKRVSPAEGTLDAAADPAALASRYATAGAAAVSVLTEPGRFGGSLEDLAAAACAAWPAGVPAMRKDFVVDPWQVLEARAAGAGGVLVMLALADDARIGELVACAREQGLFVLLESFDETELARAGRLLPADAGPAVLVGVNSRDLRTLAVDGARLARLAPLLPPGATAVAESGIRTAADAAAAAALGYGAALVGTALMRSRDPEALAGQLIAAGRSVA